MSGARNAAVAGGLAAAALALATPFIAREEGTVLKGYRDPIGVVTACTGHTRTARLGRVYSPAECERLLREDVVDHAEAIAPCLPEGLPVESQAAFLSFAFNVGAPKFCASTMARKAFAGDLAGACAQLDRWVYAGGRDCRLKGSNCGGIVRRRAAERALCERGLAGLRPAFNGG